MVLNGPWKVPKWPTNLSLNDPLGPIGGFRNPIWPILFPTTLGMLAVAEGPFDVSSFHFQDNLYNYAQLEDMHYQWLLFFLYQLINQSIRAFV